MKKVQRLAEEAAAYSSQHRKLCAVITLDVRNAFNSASWQLILEELRKREIDESFVTVIAFYLCNRTILLETQGSSESVRITSGVPQGSILGPTLWNLLYEEVLRMPEEITFIGFVTDMAMVVTAKEEDLLMSTANASLQRVANCLKKKRLKLALEKTEAVLLTKRRMIQPISFKISSTTVQISDAIKYLGVWLDPQLTFAEYVNKVITKAQRTIAALPCLMPNIGGPKTSNRKVIS